MSTTLTRRTWREAQAEAGELIRLFDGTAERWAVAGSVRRRKAECNDVEHVVIPKLAEITGEGLFGEPAKSVNAVWQRADALVTSGIVSRALYTNKNGAVSQRWGPLYRGLLFNGHLHELWTADAESWGPQLTIRTGPAEFSHAMVAGLLRRGMRNKDGYCWRCRPCTTATAAGFRCDKSCPECEGTQLERVERLSAPTEEEYFGLCGTAFQEPHTRGVPMARGLPRG